MLEQPFIAHGQNREDVVLWRALGSIRHGRYVEIGSNDPDMDSITRAFYDRGWSGITVEPDPEYAEQHRQQRPRDTMIQAAIADRDDTVALHLFPGTGLSTLEDSVRRRHAADGYEGRVIHVQARRLHDVLAEHGFDRADVHFLVVDVEGYEAEVLRTVDLRSWRPWVLVIEATEPNSTEPAHDEWEPGILEAGYRLCLFDGVSRFYVAEEHAQALARSLSYPACVLDEFMDARLMRLQEGLDAERAAHITDVLRWRTAALGAWGGQVGGSQEVRRLRSELEQLHGITTAAHREVDAIHETISWRLTKPLRALRRMTLGHRA